MLSRLRIFAGVAVMVFVIAAAPKTAAESVTGRFDHWFQVSGATRLSVDFTIRGSQDGYHYYSLSPFFDNADYGLYTGIQTTQNGPLYIFSVWNAKTGYPKNGAYSTPFSGEGVGYSLRKVQPWDLNTTYTVTLKREGFDAANNGWRWSATITNKSTGAAVKLGEIPSPPGISTMRTGAVFHERFAGQPAVCGATTNLEKTSLTATGLSSDKPVTFTGAPIPGGVFAATACKPYMHASGTASKLVTGFGMTKNEFDTILNTPAPKPQPAPAPVPKPQPAPSPTPAPQTQANTDSSPQTLPATGDTIMDQATLDILAAENARSNQKVFAAIGAVFVTVLGSAAYIAKNPFVLRRVPKLAAYLGLK